MKISRRIHPRPSRATKASLAHPALQSLLSRLEMGGAARRLTRPVTTRPMIGTVISLGTTRLETRMGVYRAYTFQDLIHKGYILALARGKIGTNQPLFARIHSSSIASETLRGCDCDDIQQLEGAMARISSQGRGILFYLMQEGRGVGYAAAARDRMLVQASGGALSTFDAYAALGLDKDYRGYQSIPSVCALLGVKAPLILLTNNPDKVADLRTIGLRVSRTEPIEFRPDPHNLSYLTSKAKSGHRLPKALSSVEVASRPPSRVRFFAPHVVPRAERFIYMASYYLPIKPVDGEVVVSSREYRSIFGADQARSVNQDYLVLDDAPLPDGRRVVTVNRKKLRALRDRSPSHPFSRLLGIPYWFKVHAYYDIITSEDLILLEFGSGRPTDGTLVRIHSESIFNRFPLESVENRDKFKDSVRRIVRRGRGFIALIHNDGRGGGFGALATDLMLQEWRVTRHSRASYERLGVPYDTRDFGAVAQLLRHHLRGASIRLLSSRDTSRQKRIAMCSSLSAHGVRVKGWVTIGA